MKDPALSLWHRAGGVALGAYLFLIPFSNAAVEIFFPILLVLWLLGWKRPFSIEHLRRIPSPNQKVFLLLGLYVAICAASVVSSSYPRLSLIGLIGKTLEYALLFVIAADLVDQPQVCRRAVRALLAAGGLVVLYGFLQEWTIYKALYKSQAADPIRGFTLDYVRMVGPYRNPNDLATLLMVTGLVAAGWILKPRTTRIPAGLLILAALLIGCMVWTRSLGAMLGLFGGFVFLGVLHRNRKGVLWGLGGLAVVAGTIFFTFSIESFREILTLSDVASHDRASMWQTAWAMIVDHPWVGHGLNTFMANYSRYAPDAGQNPAYAHNCFLQITAETGLIGLAAFGLFLAGLGRTIGAALKTDVAPAEFLQEPALRAGLGGIAAALLAFLIQSAFDTNLYALRQAVLFWTLAGAAVGMSSRLLRFEQRS
ncbi:MAG: O-antigen ligase family protein [Candidatus Omnitrophota bacterium]|nr:O-antigen ligase family protein [Candidatus Omnitrophota bacterium]